MNINEIKPDQIKKCLSLMTEKRKNYIDSVSDEKRKLESIAGEWLVKTSVSQSLSLPVEEIIIERTEKGKPYVKDRDVHISISHSGDYVAAAVDTKPVGIDIEVIKPIDLKVAERVCSQSDIKELSCGDPLIAFLKIWTAKEAYFKMTGTGIVNIKSVSYKDINAYHTFENDLIITTVN